MISSRTPRLVLAAAGLGILLVAAGLYGLPLGDGAEDPPTGVAVRVDQVGYVRGETKRAYVMGPATALAGARFEVVDARNHVVTAGRLGSSTGRWNARYSSVRTVDLSALDTPGTYRVVLTGTAAGRSPAFRVAGARELMAPLVRDNVRFLQAQRDGADVLPAAPRDGRSPALRHGPSHLADRDAAVHAPPEYDEEGTELLDERLTPTGDRVDVSGGWFDAGDFLKFTGTTSYATAALLLAQRDVPDMMELSAEATHGLAWLDRMWDEDTGTLYAQVGVGVGNDAVRTDHDVWRLPEADDRLDVSPGDPDHTIKHRPVFRAAEPGEVISPSLAGRVTAAFALAAQRAAATDEEEAQDWLDKAAEVYALADTDPDGPPLTAIPSAFYPEDSWQDDMEFGGAELALAARELGDDRESGWADDAAVWAREYLRSDVRGTLGVADVSALAHADLATVLDGGRAHGIGAEDLYEDLRRQLEDGVARAADDPFGAGAVYDDFDAVPHTFGLVATARLYASATGDTHYAAFAGRQRGWALGANPWGSSFVIGAGEVFPHCPEHQLANLRGSHDGTGAILRGAVVNGPNGAAKLAELNSFPTMRKCAAAPPAGSWKDFDGKGARYLDDVGAWQTVEPALDFTTTALLAFVLTARSDDR
ncbi:glycoside hydrolase family 9 protein [Streptomyces sp. NPDC002701]|uniref:glycoside hydrolase family 9 protein n=1 Tax=Streptomyces sp. NPDC002701 TaxID=3364661 RepID=UPI00368BB604